MGRKPLAENDRAQKYAESVASTVIAVFADGEVDREEDPVLGLLYRDAEASAETVRQCGRESEAA